MGSRLGAPYRLRPCNDFMMPFTDMVIPAMHVYLFLASRGHFLEYSDLTLEGPELSAGGDV